MKQQPTPPLAERQKPGLSETLPFEKSPDRCQGCGAVFLDLTRWVECDEWDRPTKTVVMLCTPCSKKEIERHPRLYIPIRFNAPYVGTMRICVDCWRREGTSCKVAALDPKLTGPEPTIAHLNYGGGRGEFVKMYATEPTACSAKEQR